MSVKIRYYFFKITFKLLPYQEDSKNEDENSKI